MVYIDQLSERIPYKEVIGRPYFLYDVLSSGSIFPDLKSERETGRENAMYPGIYKEITGNNEILR